MYTAFITFYAALLGIVLMIVLKRFEIKSGKKSLVSRLGESTDHVFQRIHARARFVISHVNKHNFIASAQWIAFHVLSFFRQIYIRARAAAHRHPHSKKVIDMVTGKGDVNTNGGASFYLKHIAEETKK